MLKDVCEILKEVENKSAYIADAVRAKKRLEDKAKARKLLEAAYKEAAKDDYETYKEWEPALKDGNPVGSGEGRTPSSRYGVTRRLG